MASNKTGGPGERVKHKLSWPYIMQIVEHLASKMLAKGFDKEQDRIIGIHRGGSIPATLLALRLGAPAPTFITLQSYAQSGSEPWQQEEQITITTPSAVNFGRETWFIDEIVDSGRTMEYVTNAYPSSHFAALINKMPGATYLHAVDFTNDSRWLVFPWEKLYD